ncbi:MAG: hypothetical protein AB7E32_14020 [Desulfovibrio sp.]
MRIGLIDCDGTRHPNLALMKISAWHRRHGDTVLWFHPLFSAEFDAVYASRVFSFGPAPELPRGVERGGTGFGEPYGNLPEEIEHMRPDYKLYRITDTAYGFVTRGCPNHCPWCVVPAKEGQISAHAEFGEFWDGQENIVLMDNNILAHEHGLAQLEQIASTRAKLDCNQGLDARRVDHAVAALLARVRWKVLRFACDRADQMPAVERAVRLVREAAGHASFGGQRIRCYVLVQDIEDALERVEFLRKLDVDPFAQPFRPLDGGEPDATLKRFARWVNHKAIFRTVPWEEYKFREVAA